MTDISRRQPPVRSILGELFSFDPFRAMMQPDAFGFDIARTETGYRLELPVAGFRPEDVNVTIEDRQLTIEARNERRRFTRSIVLPQEIDAERVEADVEHGLLVLNLPLHERMQPRRIPVRIGQTAGSESGTPSNTPPLENS